MICLFPRQTIQYYSNPSLCLRHECQRSWSWMVLWWPSRTNTKKDILFIIGGWNAKVGSQEIPAVTGKFGLGSTKWSKAKANRILPRECIGHSKHPFLTTQRWLYTWISPDGQYWNQTDYILCSQRRRSSIQSAKQERELTVAQIMNSLLPNSDLNWRK